MTGREKLIEAMVKAIADRSYPAHVEHRALAAAALSAIEAMGAVVVPVEIDDETADGIWRAAYDEWAEFGSLDKDAGRVALRAMLAASPYAKEPTPGPAKPA
jgi:hypothetical protein